jgi:SAM-dependent methyltransferase
MKPTSGSYYDAAYFAWQSPGGVLSAQLDSWKFQPFIMNGDVVLDFGCGGGYLISALSCRERYGIEVNLAAREVASRRIQAYASLDDLPSQIKVDVVISHHALEHVEHPMQTLRDIGERLKPNGKVVFVVPSETWHKQRTFVSADINQHLYILGNLFKHAGFRVESVDLLCYRWLPKSQKLSRWLPRAAFHLLCRLWAMLTGSRQIRIVASKSHIGNA